MSSLTLPQIFIFQSNNANITNIFIIVPSSTSSILHFCSLNCLSSPKTQPFSGMFHGRDPYRDQRRLLWRCWLWTSASRGLPDVEEGELHSTPGNAPGEVVGDEETDEATAKRARKTAALGGCCCVALSCWVARYSILILFLLSLNYIDIRFVDYVNNVVIGMDENILIQQQVLLVWYLVSEAKTKQFRRELTKCLGVGSDR